MLTRLRTTTSTRISPFSKKALLSKSTREAGAKRGFLIVEEVTLSPKLAKSRKRDRKRHLTGAKARVGGARKTRADLERQLKACSREIAHVRERLVDAMKQQTATSQVMRITDCAVAVSRAAKQRRRAQVPCCGR